MFEKLETALGVSASSLRSRFFHRWSLKSK
nr:MAG TPA: hypothetical protein [Caudoviricetes sp.]